MRQFPHPVSLFFRHSSAAYCLYLVIQVAAAGHLHWTPPPCAFPIFRDLEFGVGIFDARDRAWYDMRHAHHEKGDEESGAEERSSEARSGMEMGRHCENDQQMTE